MKLIDLLNDDKEAVMQALAGTFTPEQAQTVGEKELDKLLYRYQEETGSDAAKAAASKLIQTAKASLMFVDSDGEAKIWERLPGTTETVTGLVTSQDGTVALPGRKKKVKVPKSGKVSVWGILFFLIGVALTVGAAVVLVLHLPQVTKSGQWETTLALGFGGLIAAFLGGLFLRRIKKTNLQTEKRVEVKRDAAKIYRALQTVVMTIDKQLELTIEEEKAAEARRLAESAGPLSEEETELYASLLEALYSKDSEYALDRLEDVRFYLHKKEVDLVDYTPDKDAWFELMPSDKTTTIRPALSYGGRLLKKGLAATGL